MGKPHKKKLTPTYNGIVAAYEYEGMTPGMMWWDSAVGTRPNGVASGAPHNNWTGLPMSVVPLPSGVPPTFDGVDDTCGTGQPYVPVTGPPGGNPTGLDYRYQEFLAGHPVPLELPTTATVEAWVKPTATNGNRTFIGYHYLVRFGQQSGNFNMWLNGIGDNLGPACTINTWYHVAVTFTYGGTFDCWINGTKAYSAQPFIAAHTPARAWFIGDHQASSWPFEGTIDTVRFYNRLLTDAEIARNYHSGLRFHS